MVERLDDQDRNDGEHTTASDDTTPEGQADLVQHAFTFDAMDRVGITVGELWLHYLSMGGDVDEYEVDAYLHGLMPLPALERDMISQSVNEMIDDLARGPRAPYSTGRSRDSTGDDEVFAGDADDDEVDLAVWGLSEDDDDDEPPAPEPARAEHVLSVVYSSVATQDFDDVALADLLSASRRTNQREQVTGLLLYRGGHFVQVLEGPDAAVRRRLAVIRADPRHECVRVFIEETRDHRQFPEWNMRYEVVGPTLSRDVPGFERTFADAMDDADPAGTLRVTRDLVRWFEDHALPLG